MEKLHIRKAIAKDFNEIANIAHQVLDYHNELVPNFFETDITDTQRVERYTKLIYDEKNFILVAEEEGKVVGYLIAEFVYAPWYTKKNICKLDEISVDKPYQSKGVGKSLFKALRDECLQRCTQNISLSVYLANDRAIKLYHQLGFNEISFKMVMDL